jgi:hypothetical protein
MALFIALQLVWLTRRVPATDGPAAS